MEAGDSWKDTVIILQDRDDMAFYQDDGCGAGKGGWMDERMDG